MVELAFNLLMIKGLGGYWQSGTARPASNFRAKALSTEEILYGAALCTWGADHVHQLPYIAGDPVRDWNIFLRPFGAWRVLLL